MNLKRVALIVAAALTASFDREMIYAQGPGGPEAAGPAPVAEKPAPKPRVRWQKPLKLPDQYRTKDKDKDGQIGMYEWDKKDYATFRKLDLNHDGFLTAEELTRGPSSKTPKSPTPIASGGTGSTTNQAATSTEPATAPDSPNATTAAAGNDSDKDKPAPAAGKAVAAPSSGRSDGERQWEVLDKDKDGKVTEEEWNKSFLTPKRFKDAGIAVAFPLTKQEYLQLASQLPGASK